MAARGEPVLIAGAGIGGLTLALALARDNIPSLILEDADTLDEVGAGIQLSPNASRILIELGLEASLRKVATAPITLVVANGASGNRLAELPLASSLEQRYGAPYWVIHRADLQRVLYEAAHGTPAIQIRLGERVEGFERSDTGVVAISRKGNRHAGIMLAGADGLRSRIRASLIDDGPPVFSGFVAWRGLADAAGFDAAMLASTGLWLGAKAHLVHYPVRGGAKMNVVAIVQQDEGAREMADASRLLAHFADWHRTPRATLDRIETWHRWPLYDRPPQRKWSAGRVTLLGDAAHPMLPFLAQGGAMAIEDAAVLAHHLARGGEIAEALETYAAARRVRTGRAQMEARANGRIYHLPQPLSAMRDMVLRARSGESLMDRQDWLYGWVAE